MSRFREPQHPDFQRLNASIDFDRRLWPQDIAQSRAHARMLAARGIIAAEDRDALLAGLDAVERELRDGRFPFDADDEDIHMAIERRLTELAGPVGGRLHTARSRNDQVVTDLAMFTRERAAAARAAIGGADGRRCSRAPSSTSTGRCPATRTCSAPSPSTSAITCSPTSGCSRATARASPSPSARPAALPLGAGALAGVNFETDRRQVAAELGFGEVVAELDRRRLRPRLRARLPGRGRDLRDAPLAARRRARAVVERGVRLLRAPRRVDVGLLDHAAEEEPRRGRAAARQGAARRRPPGGPARRDPRAAADLQQGPAGGQGAPVRRRRHARAVARRRARDARRRAPSRASGCARRPPTS